MRARVLPWIAVSVAVVLFAAWIAMLVRPTPSPIPEREAHSRDSLAITQPRYDTVRLERVRTETLYVARSARASQQALATTHVADSLRAIATTLEQSAQAAADSTSAWRRVAGVRAVENDSLRAANGALTVALEDQSAARIAAQDRARAAELRLAATTELSARLAKDLRAGDRCRVLVVLTCPSRRASFAIGLTTGLAGGALAAIALDRRYGR